MSEADSSLKRNNEESVSSGNDTATISKKLKASTVQKLRPISLDYSGLAHIKKEYVITESDNTVKYLEVDDDAAEQNDKADAIEASGDGGKGKKKEKKRGQNKKRDLIQPKDKVQLCSYYVDPSHIKDHPCSYGDKCNRCHDVEKYLEAKLPDIEVTKCPNFEAFGVCSAGIKCRWLKHHYNKETGELIKDLEKNEKAIKEGNYEVNKISHEQKLRLSTSKRNREKNFDFKRSNEIIEYLDKITKHNAKWNNSGDGEEIKGDTDNAIEERKQHQFDYVEAPVKAWEKKKLNYNKTKVISPLTTVGNLPYRRLMKKLYDVDTTFSEMALSTPLIQGQNSEWALMKAHASEIPGFAAQIAASKPWQAVKATELISEFTPNMSEINLNCGCPIDLLFKQGAGSGLLEQPAKTERILKGMNLVSNDIPVTVKIRMGTRDDSPMADHLVKRFLYANDNTTGVPDIGAITLHGRSRQQRYTKLADWDYVSKVGQIVQDYNHKQEENKDSYDLPNKVFFIANGDCYNYQDWHNLTAEGTGIDTVMVARGALIKPWLFDEISAGQYLDKSASERLDIIKQYSEFAINHWGSDEYGVNLSRRFLCEWLSFTYRYIPVGILERLPNQINERPPKWKGRNELETLLASGDYKDWIKITEMFLGPVHPNFGFIPKHKSNAY
ncbi:tRNA dihydrouridine synthase [Saccharomycopsis crataegensis]|uniref:tRNA-dihydrouridine(47) synthase [NAD(P)(+)] n=1 Tax=Saccharomycopsis crataegensis TaxID=43959 RepID=A0AAV5QHU9_9ASCO|nr:tRNA dihydrouridine synthase [Saccharomycopsis crataegensis]